MFRLKPIVPLKSQSQTAISVIAIAVPIMLFFSGEWLSIVRMLIPLYFLSTCGFVICKLVGIDSHYRLEETVFLSIGFGVSFYVILSSLISALPLPWAFSALFVTSLLTLISLLIIWNKVRTVRSWHRPPTNNSARCFFIISLVFSSFIALLMVRNLLGYPYFNASDPFVNEIYVRAIQSKEFTLFTNNAINPYVTTNIKGFFFFLGWLATLGFGTFTFTRFAGPVFLFFLNIFLSFAMYRFLGRRRAFLMPLIFASNSYLVYRFLMAIPEEFSLFLFGALLLILSNEVYMETRISSFAIAMLVSAIVMTHILIGAFVLLFLFALFMENNVHGQKIRASNILMGIIGGLTISVSYPRILTATSIFEAQNIIRGIVDLGTALILIQTYPVLFDLLFLTVGLLTLLLIHKKWTGNLISKMLRRTYRGSLALLFAVFLISETYLVAQPSSGSVMGPSNFVVLNTLLFLCGLIAAVIGRKLLPSSLKAFNYSLFVAVAILLIASTASVASPRLQAYPSQLPETVRLIPEAQIIVSFIAIVGVGLVISFPGTVSVYFQKHFHSFDCKLNSKSNFILRLLIVASVSLLLVMNSFSVITTTKGWSRWRENDLELALWLKSVSNKTSIIVPQASNELLLSYVGIDPSLIEFNDGRRVEIFNSSSYDQLRSVLGSSYPQKTIIYIFESNDWLPIIGSIQLPPFVRQFSLKKLGDAHVYEICPNFQVGEAIVTSSKKEGVSFVDNSGGIVQSIDLGAVTEFNLPKHTLNIDLLLQNNNDSNICKIEFLLYNMPADSDNDSFPNVRITFISPNSSTPFAYSNTLYYDYNDSDAKKVTDATSERVFFSSGLSLYDAVKKQYGGYNIYPLGAPGETVRTISGYGLGDDAITYSQKDDYLYPYRIGFAVMFPANEKLKMTISIELPQ